MKYLQVQTTSTIDLREIFTLGLTTKRDGAKIGHKGSGLKFTLAMLHRLGSRLELWTPGHYHTSQVNQEIIRGNEHGLIVLKNESLDDIQTHITQMAGADTWTEPWFALRELVQNALDEGGAVEVTANEPTIPE